MQKRYPAQPVKLTRYARCFLIVGLLCATLGTTQSAIPAGSDSATQRPVLPASAGARVRPFISGSLAKIAAERQGRPFVLAFWSASCAYCPTELKTLSDVARAYPKLEVVLVAANSAEDAPLTADLAASYGLGDVEQWVFADAMEERLRFEIDRRWRGELPRTYFYNREHTVDVVSGIVHKPQLLAWIKANVR